MDTTPEPEQEQPKLDWVLECYKDLTRSRDIIALHILAKVYRKPGSPFVLGSLARELRLITRSKTTVYYKCKRLAAMGLIELVRGNPCLIFPRQDVNREMMWELVVATDKRLGIVYE